MTRKTLIYSGLILVLTLGLGYILWKNLASRTEIALINFPAYQSSGIILSNQDKHIHFTKVKAEDIDSFEDYDFSLVFGMGLHWSAEQQAKVKTLMDEGLQLQVVYPTSQENSLNSLDSIHSQRILEYVDSGNKKNFQNLARYIRQHIDKKTFFVTEADSLAESPFDVFYHIDEEIAIDNKADFEAYLKEKGFYHEDAPKVLLCGGLNNPYSGNKENLDSLIYSLNRAELNVYPVASMMKKMDFLEEVEPDLILNMPHGRFVMGGGDIFVDYLKKHNIPTINLLTMLVEKAEWENDPMGLVGGFMSQSVAMPELDGAIYPYVFASEGVNEKGNHLLRAIPNRLERLCELSKRLLSLKTKANAEKKLAIYYYKAPGKAGISATGLETIPSLYNLLSYLKAEGYTIKNLPKSIEDFRQLIVAQNQAFDYSRQDISETEIQEEHSEMISANRLDSMIKQDLSLYLQEQLKAHYGNAPGKVMNYKKANGEKGLVLPRLIFGNIALIIQPSPAIAKGEDFAVSHGEAKAPLPYPYVAAYLWARDIFKTDLIMHFGTHGSLEFTPSKQIALSDRDWSDQLIAPFPHIYYYQTANVGEGLIAKRRTYATLNSYLTPPFDGTNTQNLFTELHKRIDDYYKATKENQKRHASLLIKNQAVKMGLSRDLRLDSLSQEPYTEEEIERIDNFAEEVASEHINTKLYTMGQAYSKEECHRTIEAISADALANARFKLDIYKGKAKKELSKKQRRFNKLYLTPAKALIKEALKSAISNNQIASYCGISTTELQMIQQNKAEAMGDKASKHAMMMAMMKGKKPKHGKGMAKASTGSATKKAKEKAKIDEEYSRLIGEIETIIRSIPEYEKAIMNSPEQELKAIANALNGGYTPPVSGGDPISNPQVLPTGRNMYGVNAEATPSRRAWERATLLVDEMLADYRQKHGNYPKKVSFTFWSSAFIESEGTTIAQALYLLGVEPVRNMFGRVIDLRLLSEEELGRPRIDILAQTSGQFRDLAASRLFLLNRAIEMAASAPKDKQENFVSEGSIELEQELVEAGLSPKKARELSHRRIFGGFDGMYGTGIQEMVSSGDKWDSDNELAEVYIHNMGASYDSREEWEQYEAKLFRVALKQTDIVIQPRQSNTWGALSLDHVYEFMGGLNLSVRKVTGKDPEAYFADYRKRSNYRMQELKEAVGVESRATIFNKHYIEQMLQGDASSLGRLTEFVTNSYGWEAMKPTLLEDSYWNELYNIYIKDSYGLGVQAKYEAIYPEAMTEITAVMLETSRKGMWQASQEQLQTLADLHSNLTEKFGLEATDFARNNKKLQAYIEQKVSKAQQGQYRKAINKQKEAEAKAGVVMKKEELQGNQADKALSTGYPKIIFLGIAFLGLIFAFILWRKKKK